jgi:hypothetical protein
MSKQYTKGRAFEYRVKKALEKDRGIVLRTAGSHGLFDLIYLKSFIKDGTGVVGPGLWIGFYQLKKSLTIEEAHKVLMDIMNKVFKWNKEISKEMFPYDTSLTKSIYMGNVLGFFKGSLGLNKIALEIGVIYSPKKSKKKSA